MSKKAVLISMIIILSIAGSIIYLILNSEDKLDQSATVTQSDELVEEKPAETANSAGMYVDFQNDIIANTEGTKILFFHAPWCPQCRALDADIRAKGVPDGVTIIKVDYDSNQSLREKYGVTIQTTFVKVDDDGSLVEKYVAYDSPTLESVKTNLIK